jgi:glycosyltransferase involved in cell wall biosynthesis
VSSKSRKNIVWLCSAVFGLDMVVSQEEMTKYLSEYLGDVTLFSASQKTIRLKTSRGHFFFIPLHFVPLLTRLLYNIALALYMPFYIVIKKPDCIITDKDTAIIGSFLKQLMFRPKFKVILDIRTTPLMGLDKFYDRYDPFSFSLAVRIAEKKFDGITIVSESMKKEVCYCYGIDPAAVGVWTSGVPTDLFNPENVDKKELRKTFNLGNKFVIFYHGSMSINRGIIETIRSIAILKEEFDDLVLFILGEDPIVPVLKKTAKDLGIDDKVVFHNRVPYHDVPRYIAMSDVGVVPLPNIENWRNQSPLKTLEYLSMQKVIIATDIPANREIAGDSKCVIYVPSSDPDKIANGIKFAYENRENIEKWGALGRIIVGRKYDWKKISKNFGDYILSTYLEENPEYYLRKASAIQLQN